MSTSKKNLQSKLKIQKLVACACILKRNGLWHLIKSVINFGYYGDNIGANSVSKV